MNSDYKNFPVPKKYKDDYLVFPNLTFYPFRPPYSCADTIESHCYRGKTKEECINTCIGSDICDYGYWIKIPDEKSYCLPLDKRLYYDANPTYSLYNKTDLPETKKVDTAFFMNSKEYSYPDTDVAYIYANDIVSMYNINTNSFVVGKSWRDPGIKCAKVDLDNAVNLQLIPILPEGGSLVYGQAAYKIRNHSYLQIAQAGTTLVMTKPFITDQHSSSSYNDPKWFPGLIAGIEGPDSTAFALQIVCPYKEQGEPLTYTDKFYIKNAGLEYYTVAGKDNNMWLYLLPTTDAPNNANIDFKFIPQFSLFYCDRGCKEIPMVKTEIKGLKAYYKDKPTYRDRLCFGLCKQKYTIEGGVHAHLFKKELKQEEEGESKKPTSKKKVYIIVAIVLTISLLIIFMLIVLRYRKEIT